MILSNLKHFFTKNKKTILFFAFFVILFSFDSSFAEGTAQSATEESVKEMNTLTFWIEIALKLISVILGLITSLATLFLSPEWISGNIFGLSEHFKKVWILVSNVVYFIFAFLLIWIAFMNIIGKNADQYQLKQALPKFVIGVLIVPFSWFLVQFILSISAILTISAISLPADTFSEFRTSITDVQIPQKCVLKVKDTSGDGANAGTETTKEEGFWNCDDGEKISLESLLETGDGMSTIYGIISMYTYGIISLDKIDDIDLTSLDGNDIKTVVDLGIKVIFDLLFIIVYSILMITLGIVLMIRGIYIWIYTMMSPVFGLMYFFGDKGNKGFFEKFNLKEFIALSMVPVYTMLALSFGLLFMYIVGSGMVEGSTLSGNDNKDSLVTVGTQGEKNNAFITIGKFTTEIDGPISHAGADVTGFLAGVGDGALGVIGGFILKLFGIVVLWGTIMAAMRSSEITKQITEPIYQFGTKVGGIMTSAPGNIPIFGGVSAKGMSQFGTDLTSHFDQKSIKTGQKLNKKFGLGDSETSGALATLNQKLSQKTTDSGTVQSFRDAMEKLKTVEGMKNDKRFRSYIEQMADIFGVEKKHIGDLSSNVGVTKAILAIDNVLDGKHGGQFGSILSKDNKGTSIEGSPTTQKEIDDDLKGKIDTSNTVNDGLKKGSSGETFADFTVGTKDIRVTINSDGTRQVNINNGAENLGRLLVQGYSQEKMKNLLSDMGINKETEIEKTYEQIIESGIYYNKTTKKYSLTKADGFIKITKVGDIK